MVTTLKVLKRKDASSVVVAIIIAFIVVQMLPALTSELSGIISGVEEGQYISFAAPGAGWQAQYLQPVVNAALQLILLEIILWVWAALKSVAKK